MAGVWRAGALLLALSPVWASEVFSWHTVEMTTRLAERAELTFHTRTRTRQEFRHLAQFRAGLQFAYEPGPYTLAATYYVEPNQPLNGDGWQSGHRFVLQAGREWRLAPKASIAPRATFERFYTVQLGNFNRYRAGARWDYGRFSGPFLQQEWMFVNDGFQSLRNLAGWRFQPSSRWSFEAGYLHDVRPQRWEGNRHAIVTVLRFHSGE